jgi:hypothetical protein
VTVLVRRLGKKSLQNSDSTGPAAGTTDAYVRFNIGIDDQLGFSLLLLDITEEFLTIILSSGT